MTEHENDHGARARVIAATPTHMSSDPQDAAAAPAYTTSSSPSSSSSSSSPYHPPHHSATTTAHPPAATIQPTFVFGQQHAQSQAQPTPTFTDHFGQLLQSTASMQQRLAAVEQYATKVGTFLASKFIPQLPPGATWSAEGILHTVKSLKHDMDLQALPRHRARERTELIQQLLAHRAMLISSEFPELYDYTQAQRNLQYKLNRHLGTIHETKVETYRNFLRNINAALPGVAANPDVAAEAALHRVTNRSRPDRRRFPDRRNQQQRPPPTRGPARHGTPAPSATSDTASRASSSRASTSAASSRGSFQGGPQRGGQRNFRRTFKRTRPEGQE